VRRRGRARRRPSVHACVPRTYFARSTVRSIRLLTWPLRVGVRSPLDRLRAENPGAFVRWGRGRAFLHQSSQKVSLLGNAVIEHATRRGGRLRKGLPCLLGIGPRSCTRHAQTEVGSGSRKTWALRTRFRSRNGRADFIEQLLSESRFQTPSVNEACASWQVQTRASYFAKGSATLRGVLPVCENNASSCEENRSD